MTREEFIANKQRLQREYDSKLVDSIREQIEDSNLKNTPCYRLSWIIMSKINEAKKQAATEEK